MTKSKIILVIFSILACASMLVGCAHEHSFSDDWSHDETNHWHVATCEHSDEINGLDAHDFDDGEVTTAPACTTDGVKTFTCETCSATTTESVPATGHTFATTWSADSVSHWKVATCAHTDEISSEGTHTFGNDGKCTTCLYDSGASTVYRVTSVSELTTSIDVAHDGDMIVLEAGAYSFDTVTTINVSKSLTFFGEGTQGAKLSNVIFSVGNSTASHKMSVVFNNLSFEGASQIQFNDLDHVDAEIVGLVVSDLTIKNCVAHVDNTALSTPSHSSKGQFVSLSSSYDLLLNLVMDNNVITTTHTIAGEDASPIVYGNGTLIQNATFTNNVFGSTECYTTRYAVKLGRRTDDTTITFDGNTVYGATTESKDFYLLDLWQSGSDPYDNLQITISNNVVIGTPHTDKTLSLAYIESTVVEKTSGELGTLTLSNNEVNGVVGDATNVNNSAGIQII